LIADEPRSPWQYYLFAVDMDWLQLRSIERVLAVVIGGVYVAY